MSGIERVEYEDMKGQLLVDALEKKNVPKNRDM